MIESIVIYVILVMWSGDTVEATRSTRCCSQLAYNIPGNGYFDLRIRYQFSLYVTSRRLSFALRFRFFSSLIICFALFLFEKPTLITFVVDSRNSSLRWSCTLNVLLDFHLKTVSETVLLLCIVTFFAAGYQRVASISK